MQEIGARCSDDWLPTRGLLQLWLRGLSSTIELFHPLLFPRVARIASGPLFLVFYRLAPGVRIYFNHVNGFRRPVLRGFVVDAETWPCRWC